MNRENQSDDILFDLLKTAGDLSKEAAPLGGKLLAPTLLALSMLPNALPAEAQQNMECKTPSKGHEICKFDNGDVIETTLRPDGSYSHRQYNEVDLGVYESIGKETMQRKKDAPADADRLAKVRAKIEAMPDSPSKTVQLEHLCDECVTQQNDSIRQIKKDKGMEKATREMAEQAYYADRHPLIVDWLSQNPPKPTK